MRPSGLIQIKGSDPFYGLAKAWDSPNRSSSVIDVLTYKATPEALAAQRALERSNSLVTPEQQAQFDGNFGMGLAAAPVGGFLAVGVGAGYSWAGTAVTALGEYLTPAYVAASSAFAAGLNRASDFATRVGASISQLPIFTNPNYQQRAAENIGDFLNQRYAQQPSQPSTPGGLVGAGSTVLVPPTEYELK